MDACEERFKEPNWITILLRKVTELKTARRSSRFWGIDGIAIFILKKAVYPYKNSSRCFRD
jgi:hypothetical protein